MAIRNIRRQATNPLAAPGTPTSAPIYVDSDDNILKIIPAGSGTTEVQVVDASSTQTLTNKTLTAPTISSPVITGASFTANTPISATGNLSLTAAAHGGKTVVANAAAGLTFTLPAATGSGVKFRIIVGTTLTAGNFVVVVADASDYMRGRSIVANDTDASASIFETANTGTLATESDTFTANRTTTGTATIGDDIELEDIATDIWAVTARFAASGVEATPFSAAV